MLAIPQDKATHPNRNDQIANVIYMPLILAACDINTPAWRCTAGTLPWHAPIEANRAAKAPDISGKDLSAIRAPNPKLGTDDVLFFLGNGISFAILNCFIYVLQSSRIPIVSICDSCQA